MPVTDQNPTPSEIRRPPLDVISDLGGWNLYFLGKFALYWKELIGLHPLENLAFALLLLVPLKSPKLQRGRAIAAWPAAIALLYYDSWLPPLSRALSQANVVANFSLTYLLELGGRFVSISAVSLLVVVVVIYLLLEKWLRLTAFVLVALITMSVGTPSSTPAQPHPTTADGTATSTGIASVGNVDPEQYLRKFFTDEAKRTVAFKPVAATDTPFDVIFMHICSLSWDDLRAMELDGHPLFRRFDILLTRFNSAASYSGPAAIRLQRAACGQQAHDDLYNPIRANCYLMESLNQAGFKPAMVLNHDGHFDDFLKTIQTQGGMREAPMPLEGAKIAMYSFDGSPIYDDMDVLRRWMASRGDASKSRAAVYYNSISLHDGNRLVGAPRTENSMDTYRTRLKKLLDDIDGFLTEIEKSGRRAVVAIIPEHGAAVRGDKMQFAGLREIPSPAITLVPVGIKVIGPQSLREGDTVRVNDPTSYLALSEIIARLIARSPFELPVFSPADYSRDLPTTPFVAHNAETLIVGIGDRYRLKQGNGAWADYQVVNESQGVRYAR